MTDVTDHLAAELPADLKDQYDKIFRDREFSRSTILRKLLLQLLRLALEDPGRIYGAADVVCAVYPEARGAEYEEYSRCERKLNTAMSKLRRLLPSYYARGGKSSPIVIEVAEHGFRAMVGPREPEDSVTPSMARTANTEQEAPVLSDAERPRALKNSSVMALRSTTTTE